MSLETNLVNKWNFHPEGENPYYHSFPVTSNNREFEIRLAKNTIAEDIIDDIITNNQQLKSYKTVLNAILNKNVWQLTFADLYYAPPFVKTGYGSQMQILATIVNSMVDLTPTSEEIQVFFYCIPAKDVSVYQKLGETYSKRTYKKHNHFWTVEEYYVPKYNDQQRYIFFAKE